MTSAVTLRLTVLLVATSMALACVTATAQPSGTRVWQRAMLDGVELEYDVRGRGEPVVFVHAGVLGSWFDPLMNEPALAQRYRLVQYHRAGYAGSRFTWGERGRAARERAPRTAVRV